MYVCVFVCVCVCVCVCVNIYKSNKVKRMVKSDLFPLIWNPLYLNDPQATKSHLEWDQLKLYKV